MSTICQENYSIQKNNNRDKSKLTATPTILALIEEAITTTATITRVIATTTMRLMATRTIPSAHSNIISDNIFYGIYSVKILVLKRFIPSKIAKKQKRNICILIEKIISNIEFDFILNGNNISIAKFTIKINNKNDIIIKAYDEMADWCYQNLEKNDIVGIVGKLNSKMQVIVEEIYNNISKFN